MPTTAALKKGDRIQGQFEGLSSSELPLKTHSDQAAVPISEVQRITTRESDSLANGTLVGAAIGALPRGHCFQTE